VTTVAVVGAGTMGTGIVQVALEAGEPVALHDLDRDALSRARDRIRGGLAKSAARLGLDADSIDDWVDGRLAGLRLAQGLREAVADADVVIEAAVEDLDAKREIFRAIDADAAADTMLATNTSALSVSAIAAATERPDRVVGLHFFNPVPRMALVEVVVTEAVDPDVVTAAEHLVASWGKTPVRCTDTPGFIVNRVNRPFTIEALRLLESGSASVDAIDEAMRAAGYPMGPFELMDLIGIDVNLAAATAVWKGLGRPDRLRPSPIQERLVDAGRLGRKSGVGFYRYAGEHPVVAFDDPPTPGVLEPETIQARIARAVAAEAARAVADGVATRADIDLALRLGAGHPASSPRNPAG
jgi:3-hydroxybutyryl-CoA dehydrogenase